jgi:hypothetical protein
MVWRDRPEQKVAKEAKRKGGQEDRRQKNGRAGLEYRLQPAGRRATWHEGMRQKNGGQKDGAAPSEGETCSRAGGSVGDRPQRETDHNGESR